MQTPSDAPMGKCRRDFIFRKTPFSLFVSRWFRRKSVQQIHPRGVVCFTSSALSYTACGETHTAQRTTAESRPSMTSLVSLVFFAMKLFYLSDLDVEAHDAHCRVVNIITCSGVVLRILQLYAQLGDTDHTYASVNADGSPRRYKKMNMHGTPCVVLSRHYYVLTRSLGCCAHDCSIYTNLYNSTIVTLGQVCATMYSCTIVMLDQTEDVACMCQI